MYKNTFHGLKNNLMDTYDRFNCIVVSATKMVQILKNSNMMIIFQCVYKK